MRCRTRLVRAAFSLLLLLCASSIVRADDFGMIVGKIEKHYHAKKKKIPFLGLAGFAVKIVHPAGVKNLKLAIFDEQDFKPGSRDREFEQAISDSLNSKWKPMVRSTDLSTGNRSYVYSHQSGNDIEMLVVTFSSKQAIVVQTKVNPEAVGRFLQRPELMGFALAGGVSGAPSSFGHSIDAGADSDVSLASLADPNATFPANEPKKPPVLKKHESDGAPEFETPSDAATINRADPDAIRLEARLINLNVKATDRNGNPLMTLSKEDFRILENGVEQDIFYFEPVAAPVNLVLLLDLSGSTRDKRTVMIQTAKHFIDSLAAGNRIAIAAFTRQFFVLCDFTADKNELKKSLEKVHKINGGTAFYDGMWATLDVLKKLKDARKAIVVLTDGFDNSLGQVDFERPDHTFDQLLERVAEEDATIYPIYLNTDEARLLNQLATLPSGATDPELQRQRQRVEERLKPNLVAHRQVEKLAEETAGTVFVVHGQNELYGVYQRVASELNLVYTLAYAPKQISHDGKFRRINVELKQRDAVLKTRKGYIAR